MTDYLLLMVKKMLMYDLLFLFTCLELLYLWVHEFPTQHSFLSFQMLQDLLNTVKSLTGFALDGGLVTSTDKIDIKLEGPLNLSFLKLHDIGSDEMVSLLALFAQHSTALSSVDLKIVESQLSPIHADIFLDPKDKVPIIKYGLVTYNQSWSSYL